VTGKGLLLDLDGTLADSLAALRGVYFSFLERLGATGSETEFQKLNGPPLPRIVEILKQSHTLPGAPADLLGLYSTMVEQAHKTALPADGAQLVLAHARGLGWNVAVVTSSPRRSALAWLTSSGLANQVDALVGGDEVAAGKPAPDPYQLALARIHCTSARSIAVEDSRTGALSAVAAGLSTCVLAAPSDRCNWPAGVKFIDGLRDLMGLL
jgi:HAD superfamily hydrolase (TIGR01509 family)